MFVRRARLRRGQRLFRVGPVPTGRPVREGAGRGGRVGRIANRAKRSLHPMAHPHVRAVGVRRADRFRHRRRRGGGPRGVAGMAAAQRAMGSRAHARWRASRDPFVRPRRAVGRHRYRAAVPGRRHVRFCVERPSKERAGAPMGIDGADPPLVAGHRVRGRNRGNAAAGPPFGAGPGRHRPARSGGDPLADRRCRRRGLGPPQCAGRFGAGADDDGSHGRFRTPGNRPQGIGDHAGRTRPGHPAGLRGGRGQGTRRRAEGTDRGTRGGSRPPSGGIRPLPHPRAAFGRRRHE